MLKVNKIYRVDVLDGLSGIDDNSCQSIIIDPPYNIGKDFGNNKDKRELGEYLEWCDKWISECIRALKINGTMFIYGFSEILAHVFTRINISKRWLIWHYTNKNVPSLKFWQRSHESIICCWRRNPVFNLDEVREPYTNGFLNGAAGKIRAGTNGRFSKNGQETIYNAHPRGALPRDVIKIPTLAGGAGIAERWFLCKTCKKVYSSKQLKDHSTHKIVQHPTQKPMALCDKLILSTKQKDGIVLVPFAGIGSECVSARDKGLDFIGFEINREYIKIAEERIKAKANQFLFSYN